METGLKILTLRFFANLDSKLDLFNKQKDELKNTVDEYCEIIDFIEKIPKDSYFKRWLLYILLQSMENQIIKKQKNIKEQIPKLLEYPKIAQKNMKKNGCVS